MNTLLICINTTHIRCKLLILRAQSLKYVTITSSSNLNKNNRSIIYHFSCSEIENSFDKTGKVLLSQIYQMQQHFQKMLQLIILYGILEILIAYVFQYETCTIFSFSHGFNCKNLNESIFYMLSMGCNFTKYKISKSQLFSYVYMLLYPFKLHKYKAIV